MNAGLPGPIPDDLVEPIARRFRLLAEPMRLRLLDRLRDGEASVNELAEELETTQQNVSRHLALLADSGTLARRKDGTRVRYRIVDDGVLDLCRQVCRALDRQLHSLAAVLGGQAPDAPETIRTTPIDRTPLPH